MKRGGEGEEQRPAAWGEYDGGGRSGSVEEKVGARGSRTGVDWMLGFHRTLSPQKSKATQRKGIPAWIYWSYTHPGPPVMEPLSCTRK